MPKLVSMLSCFAVMACSAYFALQDMLTSSNSSTHSCSHMKQAMLKRPNSSTHSCSYMKQDMLKRPNVLVAASKARSSAVMAASDRNELRCTTASEDADQLTASTS